VGRQRDHCVNNSDLEGIMKTEYSKYQPEWKRQ
jgi:hypothetical protein